MSEPLLTLSSPQVVRIIKRPSMHCKTPYVADIIIDGKAYLAHCPALGCCGLSDHGSKVIVTPIEQKKENSKCDYRVELAIAEDREHEEIVGINPKMAETLMFQLLKTQSCPFLHVKSFGREKAYLNSRFDFAGVDGNDRKFVMEIKNVPLADYVDVPKKERKQHQTDHIPYEDKIAYFPDGYRKNATDVVSPRALKHVEELKIIRTTSEGEMRAILCFMVQRTDAKVFQPSNIDLTYKKAVLDAANHGVEIYAVQVQWTKEGMCMFHRMLPVNLSE